MEVVPYTDDNGDDEEEENVEGVQLKCPICLEPLQNGARGSRFEPVALLCADKGEPLKHVFHRECIDAHLNMPIKAGRKCPVCRKDPIKRQREERAQEILRRQVVRGRTSWFSITGWFTTIREWMLPVMDAFRPRHMRLLLVGIAMLLVVMLFLFLTLYTRHPETAPMTSGQQRQRQQQAVPATRIPIDDAGKRYPRVLDLTREREKEL